MFRAYEGEPVTISDEWVRQANNLADRFASELGQSRDQYLESLPIFTPQPESYEERFSIPLIVQPQTPKLTLERIRKIAGISNYSSNPNSIADWKDDPGKFTTPRQAHVTWLHDGSVNRGRSVLIVRGGLSIDERGGTIYDGIALLIQYPEILKNHFLSLPGSQYDFDHAPSLFLWAGRPGLDQGFVEIGSSKFASVVAGRKIVT